MSKLKTQIGTAITADFGEKTWTFKMSKDFRVTAGEFAILPKDKYDKLIRAINSLKNSMMAHPDCQEDSEFEGFVSLAEEIIDEVGNYN